MLNRTASQLLSLNQKKRIKSFIRKQKARFIRRFMSYDLDRLVATLAEMGVGRGDSLMVHSAYGQFNGFRGSPDEVISALRESIGPKGTLLMPSSAYGGSTEEFAKRAEAFDVKRSPSHMGILSEIFRLQDETLRSHNPAHPVTAAGPLASWFTRDHDLCAYSCGTGSPFEKLVETDAKVLFFDVPLRHLMFLHYVEHMMQDELPFELYQSNVYHVPVIDELGHERRVGIRVFSPEARARRRFPLLIDQLKREAKVSDRRLGNTKLALVKIRDALDVATAMVHNGSYFHHMGDDSSSRRKE